MKVYEIREKHRGVLKKINEEFADFADVLYLDKERAIDVRNHLLWLRELTYKNHPTHLKIINDSYPLYIIETDVEIF